jgi:tRNA threonylcarbamoyl adenosine modification protein YeaZ/ribosomal-protein-alanine acetyltransferase
LAAVVILAIETATRAGSLALLDGSTCVAAAGDPIRTHGERLPAEAVEFVVTAGRALSDVDLLAVVAGPGSFTGLRVGIAAVQGLALPTGRRVVPVPTLEAVVSGWLEASGPDGLVVTCMDGQRGDVFFALYDTAAATRFEECRVLIDASVGRPDEAVEQILARCQGRPLQFVSTGRFDHQQTWSGRLAAARFSALPGTLAESAARLAARRGDQAVPPHAIRPVYVRRPDAVLARARAAVRQNGGAGGGEGTFVFERVTDAARVAEVEAMQRRAFAHGWGAEALQWEVEHNAVARLYVLRDSQGAAVAYCACWIVVDELHINSLAVDEPYRRRGLARRLLGEVLADAVAAGARSATLEVRASNQAARALYEGFGFRVEAVRRDYYQTPREDAMVLWRRGLDAGGAR